MNLFHRLHRSKPAVPEVSTNDTVAPADVPLEIIETPKPLDRLRVLELFYTAVSELVGQKHIFVTLNGTATMSGTEPEAAISCVYGAVAMTEKILKELDKEGK